MTEVQQPAGWYPNPENPNEQRYWDGQQWTNNTAPAVQQPLQSTPPKKKKTWLWILLAVFILMIGGCVAVLAKGADVVDDAIEKADREMKKAGEEFEKSMSTIPGKTDLGDTNEVKDVTINSCEIDPTLGWVTVKVTAVNSSSKRSNYNIEIGVTSKDGATRYGVAYVGVQNVEPGQTASGDGSLTEKLPDGAEFICKVDSVDRLSDIG